MELNLSSAIHASRHTKHVTYSCLIPARTIDLEHELLLSHRFLYYTYLLPGMEKCTDWESVSGHLYYVGKEEVTAVEATEQCRRCGSRLVSIDTEGEKNAVLAMML